jgi:hypothetical protein
MTVWARACVCVVVCLWLRGVETGPEVCHLHAEQARLHAQEARVDVRASVRPAHQVQLLVALVGARGLAAGAARGPVRRHLHVVAARRLPHVTVAETHVGPQLYNYCKCEV